VSRRVVHAGPLTFSPPLPDVTVITDGGPWAQHTMPCPVCCDRHAILDLSTGAFGPCGTCQADGWQLTRQRRRRWFR
jgi:hypothetical protein